MKAHINNIRLRPVFEDSLAKPVSKCQTILDVAAARDERDGGGDYWNSETCANHFQLSIQNCRQRITCKHTLNENELATYAHLV